MGLEERLRSEQMIQDALLAAQRVAKSAPKGARSAPLTAQAPRKPVTLGVDAAGGDALEWLIRKESSGKTTAQNPKSSAFGLGQLTIGNRTKYAAKLGFEDPGTTDYNQQVAMMKEYIKDRYGSAEKARQFHQANGWY